MKTTRLLQTVLIFSLLLFARQVSANCMWTIHNQCIDIGTSNDWSSSAETNCNINQKPNASTAKCCCADEILGCCEKKDSLGNITTANMNGENCQNITTASTTFFQDFLANNNTCKDKNSSKTTGSNSASSDCQWKKGSFSLKFEKRCDYLQMKSTKDETKCAKSNKSILGTLDEASYQATCCCSVAAKPAPAPPPSTPPKFIIPDLQIKIPGLNLSPIDYTNNGDGSYAVSIPWIGQYISGIYNYGIGIAGILAAIILMTGGVLWLISAGDASKITQAKELITGSVIGLIILMTSYLLLYTVNPELTKFPPITIGAIQRMEFPEGDIATDSVSAIRKSTTRIVIHTAAGLGNRNEVDAFHKSKGWKGIGYNVYIERGGVSVMGRGEDTVGAHSLKYNSTSIGISYAGCAEKTQMNNKTIEQALKNNTITQTQLNTLIEKIKYYQKKYNIPRNMVIGHYEEPVSKACPCLPMDELRKLINP